MIKNTRVILEITYEEKLISGVAVIIGIEDLRGGG
jgi:hypothetical protein